MRSAVHVAFCDGPIASSIRPNEVGIITIGRHS